MLNMYGYALTLSPSYDFETLINDVNDDHCMQCKTSVLPQNV